VSDNQACCAHNRVRYVPIDNGDGTISDSWYCTSGCNTRFAPIPLPAPSPETGTAGASDEELAEQCETEIQSVTVEDKRTMAEIIAPSAWV